jgi:hypothetical protein
MKTQVQLVWNSQFAKSLAGLFAKAYLDRDQSANSITFGQACSSAFIVRVLTETGE